MACEFLLDTNVLVYAHDRSEPQKRDAAIGLLRELTPTRRAALTTQVLGEFFWVATRRLPAPLTLAEAAAQAQRFMEAFEVFPVTEAVLLEALRAARDHGLPLWDAQIWAAAKLHQVPTILSEDFNTGGTLEGVRFENPFSPGFSVW